MKVNKISLENFRNYTWENMEFSPGTNVISGNNAQGKTNLLEAIYMLSLGKSFRTRNDREMIAFQADSASVIAEISSYGREQNISIRLRSGMAKKISVNGVKKKASDLSETVNSVLFCPDDLNLIKEGSAIRRKLMDNAISQIRPKYAEILSDFNKYYENKTRILKDFREKPSLLDTLDEFSDGLCRCSAKIIRYRAAYTKKMSESAGIIHSDFSGNGEELKVEYKTVSTVSDPLASEKDIYCEIMTHLEAHKRAELESQQCLTGVHKDDMEIYINGNNARSFASQGQTRTAALSLKLAERDILLAETGEYPILLLDDVLSELDRKRQEFVLNRIGGGQTFITCCEDKKISERTGGKVIFIEKGKASICT